MRNILIGSVASSRLILQEMIKLAFPVDMVFSLDEKYSEGVSGYEPIHRIAEQNGIPYRKFKKINDRENLEFIKEMQPDYIFVVGLSQIVPREMIDCASKGVVGFHPTPLPKFRGRAAIVWQILLGVRETKCTLFLIDEGMDSGDIIGQEEYVIDDGDYAEDVRKKLHIAISKLSSRVLKQIMAGTLHPVKQKEDEATYLLVRRPEDGHIDWNRPADEIHRLVRAVSRPYPGAFGLYDGEHPVTIWRAEKRANTKYIGIPGQIANIAETYFDVLAADGLIRVTDYENRDGVRLLAGHKLK
ncbi:MAG: methionyl-tRNA formyltransferase [Lachnospiraceae bacterium]|nr:methionyl-tRNA formyltransferase [Lachnospiraceae bacterium]